MDRPVHDDQEHALDLAVRTTMMINPSASQETVSLMEDGTQQSYWHDDATFSEFLNNAFPKNAHSSIRGIEENLRAVKLKKQARLNFQPMDDLKNHLRLDRKAAIVEIFHHTAFLKEHLRFTKDQPRGLSVPNLVKM